MIFRINFVIVKNFLFIFLFPYNLILNYKFLKEHNHINRNVDNIVFFKYFALIR